MSYVSKKCSNDFIYNIGQILKDEKRDLTIMNRKCDYGRDNKLKKYYKYKCNKCGFSSGEHYKNGEYIKEFWSEENNLKKGSGCPCCCSSPLVVVTDINSIWITAKWMCNLGVSEEDAKKYTSCSNKKITVICPSCGEEKKMTINNIYNYRSINCGKCSDNFTYPERFMINVLNQLNMRFEMQYSPNWAKPKRYDFYIPSLNTIIETHGKQHYEDVKRRSARTLEEEQSNDKYKKELALANEIDKYIIIDCRYSNYEWIKNSILNSQLAQLFDLSKIDWVKCEKASLPNLIKEVCDYWNSKEDWETTSTIANNNSWGIKSSSTISRYLKKGNNLNWCEYDPKKEMLKNGSRNGKSTGKNIKVFKDGEFKGEFSSCAELERKSVELFGIKLNNQGTTLASKYNKLYKGFQIIAV